MSHKNKENIKMGKLLVDSKSIKLNKNKRLLSLILKPIEIKLVDLKYICQIDPRTTKTFTFTQSSLHRLIELEKNFKKCPLECKDSNAQLKPRTVLSSIQNLAQNSNNNTDSNVLKYNRLTDDSFDNFANISSDQDFFF